MKRISVFLLCCSLVGCSEPINPIYIKFIEKHCDSDFSLFEGYGIYRRGFDEDGNARIFVSKAISTNPVRMSGNVAFQIDSNNCIVRIDPKHMTHKLNLDTLKAIAIHFNALHINSLTCDYEGNVRISLLSINSSDLIRSNTEDLPDNLKGKWKRINTNWFVRIR